MGERELEGSMVVDMAELQTTREKTLGAVSVGPQSDGLDVA